MELTQETIEWCEQQNWDDDLRQEVYIKILEHPREIENIRGYAHATYYNLIVSQGRQVARRQELLEENEDEVRALFERDSYGDPAEEYEATEEIKQRLDRMSPLLKSTLEAIVIDNKSYEDVAEEQEVSVDVIYKRYERARSMMEEMING